MYQAYERQRTPTKVLNPQPIEISPYKEGQRNQKYANPSFVSNEGFYNKHYDDPKKQLTPQGRPLGIAPNGYGKLDEYKDRYANAQNKEASPYQGGQQRGGQGNTNGRGNDGNKDEARSQLRENYNKSRSSNQSRYGDNQGRSPVAGHNQPVDYRGQELTPGRTGSRTPGRRADPHPDLAQPLNDQERRQQGTPSAYGYRNGILAV
jgi:hypothetical protein